MTESSRAEGGSRRGSGTWPGWPVSVASVSFALNGPARARPMNRRAEDPGRRGEARPTAQPAGAGAAAGPYHDLRPGRPELQQLFFLEVLTGAERAPGRGIVACCSTRTTRPNASACWCGEWRPSGCRGWPSPGRQGRVAAALAGGGARHAVVALNAAVKA